MSLIGVSTLELRQLIEQAFAPEHCEASCEDGEWLTIRLGHGGNLFVTEIRLDSVTSCHDVFTLVGHIHEQQRLALDPDVLKGREVV
ncbi:hypothetical protein DM813_23320 [Pseudomonas alkylphenolica]|uniref:DUF1652 domain-containing protein n=1 Tax=Pseudomonas alkylphenolica TaxID=237609 RepID=A0A443ZJX1_9PSED|nr:DUF1652 domain-containing protein [Pseudomonas alkylphenolica]RWU19239.1 hypothetical protein DM813_23320 [Pseudomonas alkylphenolica]